MRGGCAADRCWGGAELGQASQEAELGQASQEREASQAKLGQASQADVRCTYVDVDELGQACARADR